MKKLKGVIVLFVLIFAGCFRNGMPTIPMEETFIATVNLKDSSITFLDGETFEKIAYWDIKEPFTGALLLPDRDRIAIYGKKMSVMQIYSLSKGKLIEEWPVGRGIVSARLINDKKEIVLVDQSSDSIRILSLDGEELRKATVGKNPISFVEDKGQAKLYVVNFDDEKITVLNSKTLKLVKEIAVNRSSAGIILHEDELWVGGHGEGSKMEESVRIYSADNGQWLSSLEAPSMPIKFLTWEDSIFILSHGSNTVYKYNTLTGEMQSENVGVNPFEMTSYHNYVAIAAYDSDEVILLKPNSFTVEKRVKVDKGPFQIFVRE